MSNYYYNKFQSQMKDLYEKIEEKALEVVEDRLEDEEDMDSVDTESLVMNLIDNYLEDLSYDALDSETMENQMNELFETLDY